MNFWETPDWIRTKALCARTNKLLNRLEYLKEFGAKNWSEEKYQAYLKAMTTDIPQEPEFLYKNYYEKDDGDS
jgi:hypothetical protein